MFDFHNLLTQANKGSYIAVSYTHLDVYKRQLLNFGFEAKECREEKLCIEVNHNEFTPEYVDLTKDFYLKM